MVLALRLGFPPSISGEPSDKNDTLTESPKKPTRTKKVATLAGILVGVFVVAELLVRVIAPELRSFDQNLFDIPNYRSLFVKDDQLHWKLRPNTEVRVRNVTIRTDDRGFRVDPGWIPEDASNAWRILYLGGSTVFGLGLENSRTFAFGVGAVLQQQFGVERQFVSYNAGVPGYSSRQVLEAAKTLIPELDPHAVIICVGNNDKWPVLQTDAELAANPPEHSLIDQIIDSSDVLTWIAELGGNGHDEHFIQQSLPAVPRIRDQELRANLQSICDLAKAQDSFPILIGPPVNLDANPIRTEFLDVGKWRDLPMEINRLIEAEGFEKALELVEEKLREDADNSYLLWHKGTLVAEYVDEEQGRQILERSLQAHPFPNRSRRTDRAVMLSVAKSNPPASYLNPNSLFRQGRGRMEVRQLFLDRALPAAAGHRLLGEWLAADITQHVNFIKKMKE